MTTEPRNMAGIAFLEVKSIQVAEWHPLPNGEGRPEQVHLYMEIEAFPNPLVMRFKSRKAIDELIVALMAHSKGVWP